ncbi:NAD-specific glutamate dehydrogenase-domain-containing protein [Aspergillus californicus]
MGVSNSRLHLKNTFFNRRKKHIEGTTTEVEDEDVALTLNLVVETIGDSSSGRLVDDTENIQTSNETTATSNMDQNQLPIGAEITADVARILDEAKVPYILVGRQAMAFYAEPEKYGDLTFVIPDDLINEAYYAVDAVINVNVGSKGHGKKLYRLCINPQCMEMLEHRSGHDDYTFTHTEAQYHPVAKYHFHTELEHVVLYLVHQGDHLWWLPPITLELPDKQHSYLTVSTDPDLDKEEGGPCGPWLGLYPVRILKPGRFIEALCWLWMRDRMMNNVSLWMLWDNMLDIMGDRLKEAERTHGRSISLWHMAGDFRLAFKWHGKHPDSVGNLQCGVRAQQIALVKLGNGLNEKGGFGIKLCPVRVAEFDLTDDEKREFPGVV